jgi:hypothetical protein
MCYILDLLSLKPFASKVCLHNFNFWSIPVLLSSTKIISYAKSIHKGIPPCMSLVTSSITFYVFVTCSDTYHNIIVHILNEGDVLYWYFVLLQDSLYDIPSHFVIGLLQVNETMCKSFFCSLHLSISCLIKKITFIVDLPDIKPNWFSVTLITPLKRCSMILSYSFIV